MASLILSEQEKAEQNDYLSASSGESEIMYANLVDTDYVVAVEITRTSSTYALRASIQDVKAAVTVDNAAYSETEIELDSFSNGDVIHKVSASLMKGLGLVVPDELLTKASDSDTKANLNIAKGMAAEKNGNTLEAISYYRKAIGNASAIKESAQKLDGIAANITGVNIKNAVSRDIKLRKEWIKIWSDLNKYMNDNWLDVKYIPNLWRENIDYDKETVDINFSYEVSVSKDVEELYHYMKEQYEKVEKIDDWGIDTSFPKLQAEITWTLKNGEGKIIGKEKSTHKRYWGRVCEEKQTKAGIKRKWKDGIEADDAPSYIKIQGCDYNLLSGKIQFEVQTICPAAEIQVVESYK